MSLKGQKYFLRIGRCGSGKVETKSGRAPEACFAQEKRRQGTVGIVECQMTVEDWKNICERIGRSTRRGPAGCRSRVPCSCKVLFGQPGQDVALQGESCRSHFWQHLHNRQIVLKLHGKAKARGEGLGRAERMQAKIERAALSLPKGCQGGFRHGQVQDRGVQLQTGHPACAGTSFEAQARGLQGARERETRREQIEAQV